MSPGRFIEQRTVERRRAGQPERDYVRQFLSASEGDDRAAGERCRAF